MAAKNPDTESIRIAHLAMVQGIIARMASNSFTLKALSVAFAGGALTVLATVKNASYLYALAVLFPVLVFWGMDAVFFHHEKCYRALYDHVRKGEKVEAYDLSAKPFRGEVDSALRLARSWSVAGLHLPVLLCLALAAYLTICPGIP